ncbi:MAG: class I SAM-dependent methyltransferase [Hyphomicrobiales bacterium]|nr:class I SAM-dependent methyltransferase [Hyphomicrobiales bacterium]
MPAKTHSCRESIRELAAQYVESGRPLSWFDLAYELYGENKIGIPWVERVVNPIFLKWFKKHKPAPCKALVVGCGLGDDAAYLAKQGFQVTAFDISERAVQECKKRFPCLPVDWRTLNLFESPEEFYGQFDFVLEIYTLQVLPGSMRRDAFSHMCRFVSPKGKILLISCARNAEDNPGRMPWPLTIDELDPPLSSIKLAGKIQDFYDDEFPPVRRFLALYENMSVSADVSA